MSHYHTSCNNEVDYSVAFARFGHCLSRCAVLMMGDGNIRRPVECKWEGCGYKETISE